MPQKYCSWEPFRVSQNLGVKDVKMTEVILEDPFFEFPVLLRLSSDLVPEDGTWIQIWKMWKSEGTGILEIWQRIQDAPEKL
jgi:hypothetical protein